MSFRQRSAVRLRRDLFHKTDSLGVVGPQRHREVTRAKARRLQLHVVAGHGVNLGPDLTESVKKLQGRKLLAQILDPSSEIHEKFQTQQFVLEDGRVIAGVVTSEGDTEVQVLTNLLAPQAITRESSSMTKYVPSSISCPSGTAM